MATSYLTFAHWSDYRGGISYARTHGAALGGERAGWFLETTGDSVYISHFNEDLINYAQGRIGYTATLAGVPHAGLLEPELHLRCQRTILGQLYGNWTGVSHPSAGHASSRLDQCERLAWRLPKKRRESGASEF